MATFNGSNVEAFIVGPDGQRTALGTIQSISADITYQSTRRPIEPVYEIGRITPQYLHPRVSTQFVDNGLFSVDYRTSTNMRDIHEQIRTSDRSSFENSVIEKHMQEHLSREMDRIYYSMNLLNPSPEEPYTKKDRTAFNSIER